MSDLIRLKSVGVSFGESVILKDISFNLKKAVFLPYLALMVRVSQRLFVWF